MNVESLLTKDGDWHAARRKTLGGSDANILMNGDPAAILHLWREKRGEAEPEDLSRVLPVQMGVWTEPLNIHWFQLMTGRSVQNRGDVCAHSVYPFMACTLDGLTITAAGTNTAVFEAKHVNAFAKIDEVVQKYMPQLHHNMAVTGLSHAILSVFVGTFTHEVVEVACDDWYLAQLIDREKAFWACVVSGEPPLEMPAVSAPVAPDKWRTVAMEGNNEWAAHAADWLECRDAAKKFTASEKGIKALMEADMGHAHGHGLECKRAKNGSLRISEVK